MRIETEGLRSLRAHAFCLRVCVFAGVRFSSGLVELSPSKHTHMFLDKGDKIATVYNVAADAGADDDSRCSGMAAS